MKRLWCSIFHLRWRKRTGKWSSYDDAIGYEVICMKCGIVDEDVWWDY